LEARANHLQPLSSIEWHSLIEGYYVEKHVGGVVIAPISGLLPSVRSAVKEALQPDGWNNTKLNEIVRSEFGFLGPFIHATIEDRSSGDGPDEPWLILEFTPPEDRDLGAAEQAFDRATRRAERGEVRPAQKTLRKLVTEFPEIAKYHRALGQTYLVLSDLDDAEDHFLHALALDPRDVDALTLLGNLYMQRERAADAIPLYERSIALQPSVYALANLGAALAKTNRVPEAIASFHRAIAVDDTYPNAWYGLGLALSELGTVDALREAIGALERALTTSMEKQETRPVYQESQRLLASLSPAVAQGLVQEAQ
jgi:tetratricopeptide (TPR) repeat protein